MNPFRKFFHQKHRNNQIDEFVTVPHSLKPRGEIKSAALGAQLRNRVLSIIEQFEAQTGQQAIILAADGVLTHPKLRDEVQKQPDGTVIEPTIPLCFQCQKQPYNLNPLWPSTIAKYQGQDNTNELIFAKA
jgi:hypothetical protein